VGLRKTECAYPAHSDYAQQPTQRAANVPIIGPQQGCANGEDDSGRCHHQYNANLSKGRSDLAMNILGCTEEEHGKGGKDASVTEGQEPYMRVRANGTRNSSRLRTHMAES
jgi:hypothetical protein